MLSELQLGSTGQGAPSTTQSDADQANLLIETLNPIYKRSDCPLTIKDNLSLIKDLLYHVVHQRIPLSKVMPYVIGFYNWVAAQYPVGAEIQCYSFCDFKPSLGNEDKAKELLEFVEKTGKEAAKVQIASGLPAGTIVKYLHVYAPDGSEGGNARFSELKDRLFTKSQTEFFKQLGAEGVKMSPNCFSRSPIQGIEEFLPKVPAVK